MTARRANHLRLAWSRFRYGRRQTTILILIVATLTALVCSLALFQEHIREASRAGVGANLGHMPFSVQIADRDVAARYSNALSSIGVPVSRSEQSVSGANGVMPAQVVAAPSAEPAFGVLDRGARARSAGEATVTPALCRAIECRVGSPVRARDGDVERSFRVTGIVVNPADRDLLAVYAIDPTIDPRSVDFWLTRVSPFLNAELGPALDSRALVGRTAARLTEEESTAAAAALAAPLAYLLPAACLSGLALGLGLAVSRRRWFRRDVGDLEAAGLPNAAAWWAVLVSEVTAVLAGALIGVAAAVVLVLAVAGTVSASLGQQWMSALGINAGAVIAATVFVAAVIVGMVASARWPRQWGGQQDIFIPLFAYPRTAALACSASSVTLLALSAVHAQGDLLWFTAVTATATFPVVVALGCARLLKPATATYFRTFAAIGGAVSITAGIVCFSVSSYVARGEHNVEASLAASVPLQPTGSLVTNRIPTASAGSLEARFRSLGGRSVLTRALPDESAAQVRVTSPTMAGCMLRNPGKDQGELRPECYPADTAGPVNIVTLTSPDSQSAADPGLVENGRVGILIYDSASGELRSARVVKAVADPAFGGVSSGASLPEDSPVLRQAGISRGNLVTQTYADFDKLPLTSQARFRSELIAAAPATDVSVGDQGRDTRRAVAITAGVVGAVLCALVILVIGTGLFSPFLDELAMFSELHGLSRVPTKFLTCVAIVLLSGPIAGGLLGRWLAFLTGAHEGSGFGVAWALPASVGVVASAALMATLRRLPSST